MISFRSLQTATSRLLTRAQGKANFKLVGGQQVRNTWHMGGPKIPRMVSKVEWSYWMDNAHFYVIIGLIPSAAVGAYSAYIGPAELREIPEGYEPEHWEYFKGPVRRIVSKYYYNSFEKVYERNMHVVHVKNERMKARALQLQVNSHMKNNSEYKGFYYKPDIRMRVVEEFDREESGHSMSDSDAMKGHGLYNVD